MIHGYLKFNIDFPLIGPTCWVLLIHPFGKSFLGTCYVADLILGAGGAAEGELREALSWRVHSSVSSSLWIPADQDPADAPAHARLLASISALKEERISKKSPEGSEDAQAWERRHPHS